MTQPRWLEPEELEAWRSFSLMQLQLYALLARELANDGLSYQDYLVLADLSDRPQNRARPSEIGQQLGWEKSRVSHHVARMEQRGLVAKERCPADQRGSFVVMTGEGRRAIRQVAPRHVELVRRHFIDLLTPNQMRVLTNIAHRVLESLPHDGDQGRPASNCR